MLSKAFLKSKANLGVFRRQTALNTYNFNNFSQKYKDITFFLENVQKTVIPSAPKGVGLPSLRPTFKREEYSEQYDRTKHCNGCSKNDDWSRDMPVLTIQEAVREANRCLKCEDAPCQKGCSTSIDIKTFIYCIQNRNWYGAAKIILSDNPLGLSCGQLCPVTELCAKNCNVSDSEEGPIKIHRLQEIAVRIFKEMGIKQIRNPSLKNLPTSYNEKIALIGAGPSSISCATFLARLGYSDITIFEKNDTPGGLVYSEIPQNRAPFEDTVWEVEFAQQLGIKINYGKQLGKDFKLQDLREQGYQAIFLGVGLQEPKTASGDDPLAQSLQKARKAGNFWTSKDFLPKVNLKVKKGEVSQKQPVPKMSGHVVVLGIGDTALDCARSAFRLGAQRVSVVFRRGFQDLRANDEIFEPGRFEGINFIPYSSPKNFEFDKDGKVKAVHFKKNLPANNDPDHLKYKETEQDFTLDCDGLITAFGCKVPENEEWLNEVKLTKGLVKIDKSTHQSDFLEWLFAGGDIIGTANLVDAVNDGKTASWYMHKYIQNKHGLSVPEEPTLPALCTAIDDVDLTTEMCGIKFTNPFGLASAPPTTAYPMIRRAFELGWGFAVTKTYCLDKDGIQNVQPRIYKPQTDQPYMEASFGNIELISEKKAAYWIQGAHEIKRDYPDRVLIASIMAGFNKEDWIELTTMTNTAPFDMIELNLSCPHGMTEKGMGRACGEDPEIVENIARWVTTHTKLPVFIKITPNYGESAALALAAKKGGAIGVTLTNTLPGLFDPRPSGAPQQGVGEKKQTAFGGTTGTILRPYALRKTAEVHSALPELEIFGSGGIISGDHALSYINYGAKAFQICSSIQNMDFATVLYDIDTSLKAHMFTLQDEKLRKLGWDGQWPPNYFDSEKYKKSLPLAQNKTQSQEKTFVVPHITQMVGQQLKHISQVHDMDKNHKVIAEINEDKCLQCGRCYTACLDSGYQAIEFPTSSEIPKVVIADCTGCALCVNVCPVEDAIHMVKKP